MTTLKAPDNVTAVSVDGNELDVIKGRIEVESHQVERLMVHGFEQVEAEVEKVAAEIKDEVEGSQDKPRRGRPPKADK